MKSLYSPDRKGVTAKVRLTWTIGEMQNKIRQRCGHLFLAKDYEFEFSQQILESDKSFLYYGVRDGSTIFMRAVDTCSETMSEASSAPISQTVHHQGTGGICWAYAVATVLRAAESRIIGRCPPSHQETVNALVSKYGRKGQNSFAVLQILKKECVFRQLRVSKVDAYGACAALKKKHVILGIYHLSDSQWHHFSVFFRNNKNADKAIQREDIGQRRPGDDVGGHGIVIYKNGGNHWNIKNSWGPNWANNGFAKIGKGAIDNMRFYHVYFVKQDLKPKDVENYEQYLKSMR